MSNRHEFTCQFSLRKPVNFGEPVKIDTSNWTDQTPEGLAEFLATAVPDWKQLIITRDRFVRDPKQKKGDPNVACKPKSLEIGRIGSGSLCLCVNPDLTVNGEIHPLIRQFFGEHKGRNT